MICQPEPSILLSLALLVYLSEVTWMCWMAVQPTVDSSAQVCPIIKRPQQTAAIQTATLCSNWPLKACSEANTEGVPDARLRGCVASPH